MKKAQDCFFGEMVNGVAQGHQERRQRKVEWSGRNTYILYLASEHQDPHDYTPTRTLQVYTKGSSQNERLPVGTPSQTPHPNYTSQISIHFPLLP